MTRPVAVSGTVIIALAVLSLGLIFTAVAIDSIPLALLAITGLAYSLVLAIARTPA